MRSLLKLALAALSCAIAVATPAAETFRNERVVVYEGVIPPGGVETVPGPLPGVVVYTRAGSVNNIAVSAGQVVFLEAEPNVLRNTGTSALPFVRVDFLGAGAPGAAPWGDAGLSARYKILLENSFARVYNIAIAAGTNEPLHTHKDRVVICLSGAQLIHLLPDGRKEPSTLKTGEVAWRKGGTHIGQNVGKTDLWAIAVEPK